MNEQRITALEKEIADLKQKLEDRQPKKESCYVEVLPKPGEKLTKVVVYYD